MFQKVQAVHPLPDYILDVQFCCGVRKRYDVKPLFARWDEFKTLRQIRGLFGQVRVDSGGYGISWNDDLDLSCNELWENGTQIGGETNA